MTLNGSECVRIEVSDLINGRALRKDGVLLQAAAVPVRSDSHDTDGPKDKPNIQFNLIGSITYICAAMLMIVGLGCIIAHTTGPGSVTLLICGSVLIVVGFIIYIIRVVIDG